MSNKKTTADLQYFEDVLWEELEEAWERVIETFGLEKNANGTRILVTRAADAFQIFKSEETTVIHGTTSELVFRVRLEGSPKS